MDEKKSDPTAPPVMPPPYEAQQAYPAAPYPAAPYPAAPYPSQPAYGAQPGYAPQPGYPAQGYPAQPGYPQGYPPQPGYVPVSSQAPSYPGYVPVSSQAPLYPGYAPPSGVVQQQPATTIVVGAPGHPKPPNNLPIALIACLCCNGCCLGLVALIFALQSDSAYGAGNVEEARRKGETAKKCAIAAIVVAIVIFIIVAILRTVMYTSDYVHCDYGSC